MKLTRVNTALFIAIIVINGYIVLLPVLPGVFFWWQSRDTQKVQTLESKIRPAPSSHAQPSPTDNRLIIPSMLFDEPINEGKTLTTLRKGLWRRPNTSTPDKSSNTVIVGHRLTYSNPRGTLYSLDKVHVGDDIGVWWSDKKYLYTVTNTKVVGPNEVSVEDATDTPQLTIYTCTPLWLPKERLVVTAKLENIYD